MQLFCIELLSDEGNNDYWFVVYLSRVLIVS
jgi:hypothetical protein